jgi:hypothetical protein
MDKVRRHFQPEFLKLPQPHCHQPYNLGHTLSSFVSVATDVRELVMDKVRRHFQPEFLNRTAANPLLHLRRLLCCPLYLRSWVQANSHELTIGPLACAGVCFQPQT